ncbi:MULTISPECIES: xanthine dehydrogenase subunit XdhA [unclassified Treponema]|uniref:xanthine dehydrogenase subunit XdhA n=1 Tax=unclassified Treponema TaxID=2638727 RepID=UPI0020A561E6|nr:MULTISPECIES: xanthine dehydrogenase subunit XdhA [unclassified Treponema]UTC43079.1 xanthine dehydrogenase molybdenum-binding subunit XdhA [Treponema sp. OMZ 857]UTC50294.1 xanthine dehydrogenase molybdenum-binding subunit XdhA [Treponema sp. OMZ 855]
MIVGKAVPRVDAYDKVTGRAKYVDDYFHSDFLVAKVLHSTIANGLVKKIDTSAAEKIPGVVKIVTCFDVPDICFPTAGHPWSTEEAHQDIADRKLLNKRVRFYGDDIAAVIAEDNVAAERALKAITVEYEEYPPILDVHQAMSPDATVLHEAFPGNVLKHTVFSVGEYEETPDDPDTVMFEGDYAVSPISHCHIENPGSYAYMKGGKIIVVSSTQLPHICRRVCGQALGIDWGKIRVIKPYIGGGFGNKQDILYEPLNAYLCTLVGGRCVQLSVSREETFMCTRTRHAMEFHMKTTVRKSDGRFISRKMLCYSTKGGYASHGHAITANASNEFKQLYSAEKGIISEAYSVFTNHITAGAMRAYGIPQADFALESFMDDMALKLNMDPIDLRLKNCMREGYEDPVTKIRANSDGLYQCLQKGREVFHWDELRKKYANQTGPVRRGVGVACFNYKTGVYPISLETAAARIMLNQDGSIQIQMGATEIGQGADTVFCQMAAEVLSLPMDKVYIFSEQDTDVSPYDSAAYASRQTYVSGKAIKKTAESLKRKILDYAAGMLDMKADELDLQHEKIIVRSTGEERLTLEEVAMESCYSMKESNHLSAEETSHCTDNCFSFGATFVEIEVDIPVGKIKVLNILNLHDSGTLINPQLAAAQVHGGMGMGLGAATAEQMLYDNKGKLLNGNLLDYKLPTAMDLPDLHELFIENADPTGPFGNKSLGEPPIISQPPAIRNALLHATGVAINKLPLNPQRLFEAFSESGLLKEVI